MQTGLLVNRARKAAIAIAIAIVGTVAAWATVGTGQAGTFVSPWPTVTCKEDARLIAAGAAGVYSPTTHLVVLRPYVCGGLAALQAGQPLTDYRYEALYTLAHELSHAGGIADEDAADCHAALIIVPVGRRIGIPAATLRNVAAMTTAIRGFKAAAC